MTAQGARSGGVSAPVSGSLVAKVRALVEPDLLCAQARQVIRFKALAGYRVS